MTLDTKDIKDLETRLGMKAVVIMYKLSNEYVYHNRKFCPSTGQWVYMGKDEYKQVHEQLKKYLEIKKGEYNVIR
jgi:hypothetical protein